MSCHVASNREEHHIRLPYTCSSISLSNYLSSINNLKRWKLLVDSQIQYNLISASSHTTPQLKFINSAFHELRSADRSREKIINNKNQNTRVIILSTQISVEYFVSHSTGFTFCFAKNNNAQYSSALSLLNERKLLPTLTNTNTKKKVCMPGGSCFCMHTSDIRLFGNKQTYLDACQR